jgi:hypothetical protein
MLWASTPSATIAPCSGSSTASTGMAAASMPSSSSRRPAQAAWVVLPAGMAKA